MELVITVFHLKFMNLKNLGGNYRTEFFIYRQIIICMYAFIYFRKTIFLRYFVATRDIQPLELVVVDEAAVIGPSTKTKPLCLECLKPPTQVLPGISLDQIDQLHYCKGCGFLMCAKCDQIENKKLHLRQECDILAGSGLNKEVCS